MKMSWRLELNDFSGPDQAAFSILQDGHPVAWILLKQEHLMELSDGAKKIAETIWERQHRGAENSTRSTKRTKRNE